MKSLYLNILKMSQSGGAGCAVGINEQNQEYSPL